jgi:flagella basal body P-ring formation protein FlgA
MLFFLAFLIIASSYSWASTQSYSVTHDDIISSLDSFLKNHDVYGSIPYRLYSKRIMDTVSFDNELSIRIVDRSRDKLLKSDNFQVAIMSSGKTLRRFELKTYVGIEVPIAVVTRDLKRGERIDDAYEFRWCDLTGSPVRAPMYEGDEIKDRVVRVTIRAGRELDRSILEAPDLVKRGDKIIAIFTIGGLTLTMSGRALDSGKLGDSIKILNEVSGRTIVCEVTGSNEVRVMNK